ncbi:MAG: alpha/beta fold hydrolase [Solirubrobacterales bacterium]
MPVVDAGNVELSYERSGSGPPLLLIMGLSGTLLHWGEPFMEELRTHFDTIVYDHRGVGASSRVEAPFTIADLATDAAGLLGALGVESAHVMGISMGGMIAQELALAHPELLRTLTLGCTYCGGPGSSLPPQPELGAAIMSGDRDRAVRAMWEANVSKRFAQDDEAYARFHAIGLERSVAVAVTMEQLSAITRHDTSARLGDLEMPTLVVHGTEDAIIPVENGRMVAGLIPGARLEIWPDTGHLFFWEQPERSAELVCEHALVHA